MRYVYVNQRRMVQEIIPEYVKIFPGIPADKRYSPDFLKKCLPVEDFVNVELGMEYLPIENMFVWPVQFSAPTEVKSITGENVVVRIHFHTKNPTPGTWKIADDSPVSGTVYQDIVTILPLDPGEYTLIVEYSDEARTIRQEVKIKIIEAEASEANSAEEVPAE